MAPSRRQILLALAYGATLAPGCVAIDASTPARPAVAPRASCVPADAPCWTAPPAFPVTAPAPTPGVPLAGAPK